MTSRLAGLSFYLGYVRVKMKKIIPAIIFLLIGAFTGWWGNEMYGFAEGVQEDAKNNRYNLKDIDIFQLDFDAFLYEFSTDKEFQKKHIRYPLPVTETIMEKNEDFHYSVEDTLLTQIPDHLDLAVHYTDNLDSFVGSRIIQKGDHLYFFEFDGSAWYLMKIQELLK